MMELKANKVFSLVCSALFLFFPAVINAQNPVLTATADKQSIVIGEPLEYRVEAIFPVNTYSMSWLSIPDSTAHFEVIERKKPDTTESNGMLKVQQVITLTSFDSGKRTIPSFGVTFSPVTSDTGFNMLTDSIPVNVTFSPMDTTKTFHDIKNIIMVEDKWPWWVWAAAALSLILLIFLIYYLLKKWRKKSSPDLFTSKLSPLEEAIRSLNELEKDQLLGKQQVKLYHSTLGEIFKRYISRKTGSNLLSLTSEEILITLNDLNINKENVSLTANTMRMADAVKFAKFIPGTVESEEALSTTRKVISLIDQSLQKSKSGI